MIWTVEVIELRAVRCLYKIDAASVEEAAEKAAIGDTVKETDVKHCGVHDRHVQSVPQRVKKGSK